MENTHLTSEERMGGNDVIYRATMMKVKSKPLKKKLSTQSSISDMAV